MVTNFLFLTIFLVSCGSYEKESKVGPSSPKKPTWVEIKPKVEAECVRCHNGTKHPLSLASEDAFKSPKVQARISNNSMPPDKALAGETKSYLLSYF